MSAFVRERLSRVGACLGNWNDRVNGGDTITSYRRPRAWRTLDRIAHRLYTLPDVPGPLSGGDGERDA